jgi:phosphoribosylglycinamide formyltransferase-1
VYRFGTMRSYQKHQAESTTNPTTRVMRLAVLISGSGRSLDNFLKVIGRGALNAHVAVVVSSVPNVRGLEIARSAGIPAVTIRRRDYASEAEYSDAIYTALDPYQPDLILLAGFLRKLVVPGHFEGRILNIHPALLPESDTAGPGFYGQRVHTAVLASGAEESGATVHVVDNGYDTGPVVLKTRVPIMPGDTPESLAARVFEAECSLYPEAVRQYVSSHPELFE